MKLIARLIMACIDIIRPTLGPQGCCIYPITCREYAYDQLLTQPLYRALPHILLRVARCNPITRFFYF